MEKWDDRYITLLDSEKPNILVVDIHTATVVSCSYSSFIGLSASQCCIAGGMRSMTVKFPQMDDMEDHSVLNREAVEEVDEGVEPQEKKRARKANSPVRGVDGRGDIRESQITVPETPTPELMAAEAKRKEYARASGRLSALEDTAQTLPDSGLVGKKRRNRRRLSVGKDLKMVVMQTTGNGTSSLHKEICIMAAETFGKIRQLLVERTVDTLNEAFLHPL